MLVCMLILPFHDFCSFRSVAVNSVYKFLHLFTVRIYRFTEVINNYVYHLVWSSTQSGSDWRVTHGAI